MNYLCYRDKKSLEKPLSQGDIFCNLPRITFDYLKKSNKNKLTFEDNNADKILSNILQYGDFEIIETIITPTWGILASQDCDIRDNKDLIFYPLIRTKKFENPDNIASRIEKEIRNSTRMYYLPEIKMHGNSYGPFKAFFYNPFVVPFNLIKKFYNDCWRTRIIDEAKKVFVGKISHFYTRTPMDTYIFLTSSEISLYLNHKWKKFKKDRTNKKFAEISNTIYEIKKILYSVNREKDFAKIVFYDTSLINTIEGYIKSLQWDKNFLKILKETEKINNLENPNPSTFKKILNNLFFNRDNILQEKIKWSEENEDELREISKNGGNSKTEIIIPKSIENNVESQKKWAKSTREALKELKKLISKLNLYENLINSDLFS